MEEILQHLRCIKRCKCWDICHIRWCNISSINSISKKKNMFFSTQAAGAEEALPKKRSKPQWSSSKEAPLCCLLWLLRYVCNGRGGEGQLKKPRKKWCRNFLRWKNVTWSHLRHFMKWSFLEAVADQLKAAGVQAANLLEEPVDLLPPARSPSLFQQRYDLWPTRFATPVGEWLLYDWMVFQGFFGGLKRYKSSPTWLFQLDWNFSNSSIRTTDHLYTLLGTKIYPYRGIFESMSFQTSRLVGYVFSFPGIVYI